MPVVERRETCFVEPTEGVLSLSDAPEAAEIVLPVVRLRLRMVTEDGMYVCNVEFRGDDLGGVEIGAGSLERAECTRCSRRCICAVRDRI